MKSILTKLKINIYKHLIICFITKIKVYLKLSIGTNLSLGFGCVPFGYVICI